MPLTTSRSKFPLLPIPGAYKKAGVAEDWSIWASRLVKEIEKFFANNPYSQPFPVSTAGPSLTFGPWNLDGITSTIAHSMIVETDGRPLLITGQCHYKETTSDATNKIKLVLYRDTTILASANASYGTLASLDKPSMGKYTYKMVVQSEVSAGAGAIHLTIKNNLLTVFDRL